MASFEQLRGMPNNLSIKNLTKYVSKISKELNWLLNNLDDLNITSLSAEKIIAGTVLVDVNMSVGSGNDIFKVDSQGIYLGDANFDDAPFSVDMDGYLNATNAYINGTIESSSIIGSTIKIGSLDNVFKADSNGIYAGDAVFASAPFSVDMQGNLYATNAAIQGDISSSTIEGGTITGATIATDFANNVRMELSGSGLISYNDENKKEGVCIETGDYGFSTLRLYQNGVNVGGMEYNSLGVFSIGKGGASHFYIFDASPIGTWTSGADFIGLYDGTSNYATELWVTSQGYITGTTGASGTFTTASETVTVVDGLITEIV